MMRRAGLFLTVFAFLGLWHARTRVPEKVTARHHKTPVTIAAQAIAAGVIDSDSDEAGNHSDPHNWALITVLRLNAPVVSGGCAFGEPLGTPGLRVVFLHDLCSRGPPQSV